MPEDIPDNTSFHKKELNTSASETENRSPSYFIGIGFYTSLGVALLCVICYFVYHLCAVFVSIGTPFVVGVVLALLLDPAVLRLERRGMSRHFAIFLVFLTTVLILAGIGAIITPRLTGQLAQIKGASPQQISNIANEVDKWLSEHRHIGPVMLPPNSSAISTPIKDAVAKGLHISVSNILDILTGSASMLLQIVVSLLVMVYVLADTKRIQGRALFLVPTKFRDWVHLFSHDIETVFSDYLRGLLIVCSLYGATVIGVLYLLSIWYPKLANYALLCGICAGVLYSIPYIGAATIALMMFGIGYASGHDMGSGLIVTISVLSCNFVFDNVVTPNVVGGGVGLHPVATILALGMGVKLGGFWGLLVAVPVVASIQAILFRIFPKLTNPTPQAVLESIHSDISPSEAESKIDRTGGANEDSTAASEAAEETQLGA
jgi:predicted PurR-regulated permease PerM